MSKGPGKGIKIIGALGVVVLVFVGVVLTRPAAFHIERSANIAAPPARVFAHVNDFHKWSAWSPWEKLDPAMKKSYEGAPSGVGAIYAWTGNNKVGQGRMTIEKSVEPTEVQVKLEFIKPFAATNTATFTFAPAAGGTRATWAMDGRNNFMAKAASLFMDMDKLVGGDFERGLAALKSVAEHDTAP